MTYHPLANETGGSPEDRSAEARKLLELIKEYVDEFTPNERKFFLELTDDFKRLGIKTAVSAKQVFWLRDIRDKYLMR